VPPAGTPIRRVFIAPRVTICIAAERYCHLWKAGVNEAPLSDQALETGPPPVGPQGRDYSVGFRLPALALERVPTFETAQWDAERAYSNSSAFAKKLLD
jgi:hypothetical protein